MSDKVRIGIIGVGTIGSVHANNYAKVENAEVVALCDILPDRLAEKAKTHEVAKTYADYNDLLADPEIDAVSVCVPNDMHAPIAIAALNALGWLRVLDCSRHTNKLRMGHLRGNSFTVNLHGVTADDEAISKACAAISANGFLNYFGKQRFGFDGANVAQGVRILSGGRANHQMKKLYVSAVQSAIFNLTIARRYLEHNTRVFEGDVLQKKNAGCFVCTDPQTDQLRANQDEVVVTHALPGKKVMHGHGISEAIESSAIDDFVKFWSAKDLQGNFDFTSLSRLADGTRRPMWIRAENIQFKRNNTQDISISFVLPAGCYATVFLRHLCGASFTR